MNTEKLSELEARSDKTFVEKFKELRERAEFAVKREITEMKEEGKILELTEDEERMLKAYRAFCSRSKPGKTFGWKTPEEKNLILPGDVNLILDPREVVV